MPAGSESLDHTWLSGSRFSRFRGVRAELPAGEVCRPDEAEGAANRTRLDKEVPFCRDAAESCWSQNRRGYFVIRAK
jgi:hypothetical protein